MSKYNWYRASLRWDWCRNLSAYSSKGGASNYLCLPHEPQYSSYTPGVQPTRARLTGLEYETGAAPQSLGPLSSVFFHNVPCAVCTCATSQRGMKLMIPAWTTCPETWTREYHGYLMANYDGHRRTMFECIDANPETIPGSSSHQSLASYFYHVEATCSGIPCLPYEEQKEITCVVCTK